MSSRRNPYDVYIEREAKKKLLLLERAKEDDVLAPHKQRIEQDGSDSCNYLPEVFDEELEDWRYAKAPEVTATLDSNKLESGSSILPETFGMVKGFPAYLPTDWKANSGYPRNILINAKQSSRNAKDRKAAYSLDGFLYSNLIGRMPRRSTRNLISWNKWCKLKSEKIEKGEWELVAEHVRFRNQKGKMDGRAAVYAITPAYLKESLESELDSGRYNTIASLENRKRVHPDRVVSVFPNGIPNELKSGLANGTGIRANPKALLNMLFRPDLYRMSMYTSEEVWRKAVFGWRKLSPFIFNENLIPAWVLGKNGWLYTCQPCLQSIPKLVRMIALEGLNGERVMEIDFTGCQLNIARVLNGLEMLQDPYEDIQTKLRSRGIDLDRKTVKKHTLAGFGGRTVDNYKYFHRFGEETDPPAVFEATLSVLIEIGYPINDNHIRQAQGKIMAAAMTRMVKHTGFSGLSIHDALLVPTSLGFVAAAAMEDASQEVIGVKLPYNRISPFEVV